MAMAGKMAQLGPDRMAPRQAFSPQIDRRRSWLHGLAIIVSLSFLAAAVLPISLDGTSLAPGFAAAWAGDGGNGDGKGRGKGNGKGRGDENGGGVGGGANGDGLGDSNGGANDDSADFDGFGGGPVVEPGDNGAGTDDGAGDYADDASSLAGNAPAGAPSPALPTVKEIFALGEDSVLTADQEILAIKNGWSIPN